MHSLLSSSVLVIAALGLPNTFAAPRPEGVTCSGGAGNHGYTYTVTSQNDVAGDAQVGDYSVSGATGSKSSFSDIP